MSITEQLQTVVSVRARAVKLERIGIDRIREISRKNRQLGGRPGDQRMIQPLDDDDFHTRKPMNLAQPADGGRQCQ